MSTADIYDANVKTLKANAEVLADTQNALLEHIFEGSSIDTFKPIFEDNAIETLNIPEGITTIANRAFMGRGVQYLTIASTVESIGYQAFSRVPRGTIVGVFWTDLLSVTFASPSSLKLISESAFASTGIESITLPEGVEQLGAYALAGIATVVLPQTITTIGSVALRDAMDVTFQGKTRAEVLALANFPWNAKGVFHCDDGDIYLYRNITGPVMDTRTGENDRCSVNGGRIYFTETEPIYCDFNNPDDGVFFVTEYDEWYRLSPDSMDTSKVDHTQFLVYLKDERPGIAEGGEMSVTLVIRTTYGVSGGDTYVAEYPKPIVLYG